MKRYLSLLAIVATLGFAPHAHASGHPLVVDDVSYEPTHVAGSTYHFETPGPDPQEAYFAERDQWWHPGDNGSEHLPCEYGVHWISNENNLTVSNCLEAPSSTSTTSTSTTTTTPDTSSTAPSSTSTTPAPTTTVPESTSTSSPTTSTDASTTSVAPSTTSQSTSTTLHSDTTSTSPAAPSTSIAPKIPVTGADVGLWTLWAVAVLAVGWALIATARRRA